MVLERVPQKVKPPQMYQVVMLNDDYTPMEFVVVVIQEFFGKDRESATQIMLKIHLDGRGVCGVYSRDVAATKVEQVLDAARRPDTRCSVSASRWTRAMALNITELPPTVAVKASRKS